MLINTIKKALRQGSVGLTRHRVDLISRLVCPSAFGQYEKTRV